MRVDAAVFGGDDLVVDFVGPGSGGRCYELGTSEAILWCIFVEGQPLGH